MKLFYHLLAVFVFLFSVSLTQAQAKSNDGPCKMMSIHCKCENPHKDFVIPKQKVGKTNPTDPGACWSSKDIDELLNTTPMVYCMSGADYQKDPSKAESKCTATWTCVQPCDVKDIGTRN